MPKTVYLAGPITGQSYDGATGWREDATRRFGERGIVGLSPMRGKRYLKGVPHIGDSYEETILSGAKGITACDRWDCMRCDVLLVNFIGAERVSIGTCMEIAWADAYRKPIVVAMEKNDWHDHAMIREVTGFLCPSLEAALTTVEAILNEPTENWPVVVVHDSVAV